MKKGHTVENIYCNPSLQTEISEIAKLTDNEYYSFSSGKTEFKYNDFFTISDLTSFSDLYLIGDYSDLSKFREDLLERYSTSRIYKSTIYTGDNSEITGIWAVALIITSVLTLCISVFDEKENCIRVINGESRLKIFLQDSTKDSIICIAIFIITFLISSRFVYSEYCFNISLKAILLIVAVNFLLRGNIFFLNYKKAFSNRLCSTNTLVAMYVLKMLSVAISIVMISANLVIINQAISVYKQKDFVEEYKEYAYTYVQYKFTMNETTEEFDKKFAGIGQLNEKLYRKFFDKAFVLCRFMDLDDTEFKCLIANKNALEYLNTCIPGIQSKIQNEKVYILFPKTSIVPKEDVDTLAEEMISYCESAAVVNATATDYELIYYENTDVLYSHYGSNQILLWADSPMIILDNSATRTGDVSKTVNQNYAHGVLYNITEKELQEFSSENGLTKENSFFGFTNLAEHYNGHWELMQKELILSIILTIFSLFLEYMLISVIIKFEYDVNAMELAVKKVSGYGLFERNFTLALISVFTMIISTLVAFKVASELPGVGMVTVLISSSLLFVFEMIILVVTSCRFENKKIAEILKGGSL